MFVCTENQQKLRFGANISFLSVTNAYMFSYMLICIIAEYDQVTRPESLPIKGNLSDIRLEIIADSEHVFVLKEKRLKLKKPLDRDVCILCHFLFPLVFRNTTSGSY